jgi:hypothetical protein
MPILDRIRSAFLSPADRRLAAAEREAWSSAPAPLVRAQSPGPPFAPQGPPQSPSINWGQDQPPPPPTQFVYVPGYSDHVYQQFSAPLAFENWDLERIRAAVALHRLGNFIESAALMIAILSFAPVLAALQQAVAPIMSLPKHVHGGPRGLAKLVAAEVREQLLSDDLMPSPYLPPTVWGTMAIYLRMMGFCVLQHIDGDPDPETGVRPRYTRIWEPWAVIRYRSPRKDVAITTEGTIEIKNDGKFTMVETQQEGHLFGAIVALGEETIAGKLTQQQRLSWLDFFGKNKLVGTMPEKVAVDSEAGKAFLAAVTTIFGPDGHGVLPYGADLKMLAMSGEGAGAFKEALFDHIIHIYMVLTGSAGTIGSGSATGAGPYQPQKGGVWNVRHDLIALPVTAQARGINQGHIAPFCDENYADAIERAKRAGVWQYPIYEVPLPAPDRDERIKSEIERQKAYTEQLKADREAGGIVDQERANRMAERFEVLPLVLADAQPRAAEIYQYHIENKIVAPDEARERLRLEPLPDGAGSVERLAEERLAGGDKPGALAQIKKAEGPAAEPDGGSDVTSEQSDRENNPSGDRAGESDGAGDTAQE